MTAGAVLETRDLEFSYGDGEPVLRGLSLQVERGEWVALIGQNGSGKTSLAKQFNGLLRPTRGAVWLDGEPIANQPVSELARRVGYVFQNPDHQIFSPTVFDEIAFGPRNLGLDEAEVKARVEHALERFGLVSYASRPPAVLGFGIRRKTSIAAVVAMQTAVLVLDEPTAGLDARSTGELMAQLGELHRAGRTLILITHDMRLVADHIPHCIVLHEGRILARGDTRALFQQVERLRQTHITPPQITRLAHDLAVYGMRNDILTVSEFCEAYRELLASAPTANPRLEP